MTIKQENITKYLIGTLPNGSPLYAEYNTEYIMKNSSPQFEPYWVVVLDASNKYWLFQMELVQNMWIPIDKFGNLEYAVQAGIAYLKANCGQDMVYPDGEEWYLDDTKDAI